jgi:predicted DNA-binding protein
MIERLRALAAEKGIPLAELIRRIIDAWLEKMDGGRKP